MARSGKINFKNFERLQKNLEKLNQEQVDSFIDACAKELAARLLAKAIKRTPVGDYPNSSGKKGGTLRRGWTAEKSQSAKAYIDSLKVNHFGNVYTVEITNPTKYASYVEYGHRTRNHKGWVQGHFMLQISVDELNTIAPNVLQQKLNKKLKEVFG